MFFYGILAPCSFCLQIVHGPLYDGKAICCQRTVNFVKARAIAVTYCESSYKCPIDGLNRLLAGKMLVLLSPIEECLNFFKHIILFFVVQWVKLVSNWYLVKKWGVHNFGGIFSYCLLTGLIMLS